MKIAVLGATGGSGRLIASAALAAGHEVTAVVRRPDAVTDRALQVAKADVGDAAAMRLAIRGHDAVVWAVGGHDKFRSSLRGQKHVPDLNSRGTAILIDAMREEGVQRLLVLSSWGVGDSAERLPFFFRRIIMPLLLKAEFEDKAKQEELVRNSGLRWTIVRPTRLTDGARSGQLRIGYPLSFTAKSHTPRINVAELAVAAIEDESYVNQLVEITA